MKKIKFFLKIAGAGILISQSVLAQENASSEKDFTKIVIPDHAKVFIAQGDASSVRLEMENATGNATIDNNTLTIHGAGAIKAYVTVKKIEEIEISGNGSVETEGAIKTDQLNLLISGYGKMEMEVDAGKVSATISGRGKIELAGSANELNAEISGAGKIDASDLKVSTTTAVISGAGKINTDTKDALNADISGVGSVHYINAPATVTKHISGIGKVGDGDDNYSENKSKKEVEYESNETHAGSSEGSGESNNNDEQHRVEIKDGKGNTIIHYNRRKNIQAHWGGFELGFNNYGKSPFSADVPAGYEFLELNTGKSIAVNLNLFDWSANIAGYHLMFVTGLGITWNNWRFQNDSTLVANVATVSANNDKIDYSKNKLTASYATLPVLFEYNSSPNEKKTFHVAAGVIFGYRIGSHTKQVYEENSRTRKIKTYDDFNLETFRYDATLRIGYRGYTVFASYDMAKLFKSNQGPELHPYTIGLTLVNW